MDAEVTRTRLAGATCCLTFTAVSCAATAWRRFNSSSCLARCAATLRRLAWRLHRNRSAQHRPTKDKRTIRLVGSEDQVDHCSRGVSFRREGGSEGGGEGRGGEGGGEGGAGKDGGFSGGLSGGGLGGGGDGASTMATAMVGAATDSTIAAPASQIEDSMASSVELSSLATLLAVSAVPTMMLTSRTIELPFRALRRCIGAAPIAATCACWVPCSRFGVPASIWLLFRLFIRLRPDAIVTSTSLTSGLAVRRCASRLIRTLDKSTELALPETVS